MSIDGFSFLLKSVDMVQVFNLIDENVWYKQKQSRKDDVMMSDDITITEKQTGRISN